jgi:hypothetical protein
LANNTRRCWLLVIVILAPALALACMAVREHVATYLRGSQLPSPLAGLLTSVSTGRGEQPADLLPQGTVLLSTLQADLDNDGLSETLLVFNAEDTPYESGAGGVIVLDEAPDGSIAVSELRPRSEGSVTDAGIRDINLDGVLELLVYKSSEDETNHYLHVFAWRATGWTSLGPDGEEAFLSAYYPPQVRNIDSANSEEITVFEDSQSGERLDAVVYSWDGDNYTRADWIVTLGPLR